MGMEWNTIILTTISALCAGGIIPLLTIKAQKKKAMAEAKQYEQNNIEQVSNGWKAIADERQEHNKEKDAVIKEKDLKIDSLYEKIEGLRVSLAESQQECANLKIENMRLNFYRCTVIE